MDYFCYLGRGASSNDCDETYRGPSAMPELSGLTNWFLGLKAAGQPFHLHIGVHAYGLDWLYPWGYSALIPLPSEAVDMVSFIAYMFSVDVVSFMVTSSEM